MIGKFHYLRAPIRGVWRYSNELPRLAGCYKLTDSLLTQSRSLRYFSDAGPVNVNVSQHVHMTGTEPRKTLLLETANKYVLPVDNITQKQSSDIFVSPGVLKVQAKPAGGY